MDSNYRRVIEKFQRIIELSNEICEKADYWYCKTNTPLSRRQIYEWCFKIGIVLPDEYIACLTLSNGFYVDFASTVGYFNLQRFKKEKKFTIDQQRMLEKKKSFKECIGWLNHQCIYHDVFTGELFIERKRYHYEPIKDFVSEILEPVIVHLESEMERSARGKELLLESKDNPLRHIYDRLLKFIKPDEVPDVKLCPPASEDEISHWEKTNGIKLPSDYRNWLKLSNGSRFGHKFILGLDELRKGYESELIDGVEYVYIVGLTGCFDYLLFNSLTGEYFILTEDFELEKAGDFEDLIFLEEFEYMEERMTDE